MTESLAIFGITYIDLKLHRCPGGCQWRRILQVGHDYGTDAQHEGGEDLRQKVVNYGNSENVCCQQFNSLTCFASSAFLELAKLMQEQYRASQEHHLLFIIRPHIEKTIARNINFED